MTTAEQRRAALLLANESRTRISELKRALRSGQVALADVLTDPPDEFQNVPLVDVVRWSRGDVRHGGAWFPRMGRRAVADGVNLMVPLGQASLRTRLWVVDYASWYLPSRRTSQRIPGNTKGQCSGVSQIAGSSAYAGA